MKPRGVVGIWVAAAVLVAGVAAPPADARRSCTLKRAKDVVKTRSAVVVRRSRGSGDDAYYGCLFKRNRLVRLNPDSSFGSGSVFVDPRPIALVGSFVAFSSSTDSPAGAPSLALEVWNLGKRRQLIYSAITDQDTANDAVLDIALTRRGAVAWIGENLEIRGVFVRPLGRPLAMLDQGKDIDPSSLTLGADAHTLTWTKAGMTTSGVLE